jgi:hypothetical protein
MTCEEVKALLTDYLDKTLDTATTTRVATHLISCAPCGALAGDLTDCIREISALPTLDPPLGFAQRVMAHVRELEPKRPLWQRLLSPLTAKIPLPATAAVMIGILGLFLYQRDDNLKYNDRRETTVPPATAPKEQVTQQEIKTPLVVAEQKQTKAEKPNLNTTQVQRARETAEPKVPARSQIDTTTKSAPPASDAGFEESRAFRRAPIPVQETSSSSDTGRFGGAMGFGPPMPVLESLRQSGQRPEPFALERVLPLGQRIADYEYIVRRRPAQRRVTEDSVDFSKSVGDELAARPAAPASTAPRIESIAEIRFYNVAPEHFEFFKKELASEAIVESESKATAKEKDSARFDRNLLIKVTILPATSPESDAPSR